VVYQAAILENLRRGASQAFMAMIVQTAEQLFTLSKLSDKAAACV
jgi:hypothetical protein